MKKLLLINPWAVNNDGYYARGFINGIKDKLNITFTTNYFFEQTDCEKNIDIKRFFFKYSEKMERGLKRKIIRGLEYIKAYFDILMLVKRKNFDIVHIHWLLFYKIDTFFLKKMKNRGLKIVLTAHNVIPHRNGESYISQLNKIYSLVDKILVHGEAIKEEFTKYFPQYESKVQIQYHGTYFNQNTEYDENKISSEIKSKVNTYEKVFLMLGAQFFNKGTDRLIKSWLELDGLTKNSLLIIAGRIDGSYPELDSLKEEIEKKENIILLDYFIDDNTANYLFNKSSLVIIPYRHASMSGVVFTASEFKKTVICTKTGALYEYLEDGIDSFICENNDESFKECLKKAVAETEREKLCNMGNILEKNIREKYSWNKIGDFLINEIYREDDAS